MGSTISYVRLKLRAVFMRTMMHWFILPDFYKILAKVPEQYPDIKRERLSIPSRDLGRNINAVIYQAPPFPKDSLSGPTSSRPVLVNWHGSGFIFPFMFGSDAHFCSEMASKAGISVLDVDYRKAPEYPWPAAINDVEDVLIWTATEPDRFDINKVATSGFSAGATLALVAAGALRSRVKANIRATLAFYPLVDFTIPNESRVARKQMPGLSGDVLDFFRDCYLPDEESAKNPLASPARSSAKEFPPTVMMVTAEGDRLAPEGDAFAQRLKDGQKTVIHKCFDDVPHGFDKAPKEASPASKARDDAYSMAVETLKLAFKNSARNEDLENFSE